jgi:hypothetical protein
MSPNSLIHYWPINTSIGGKMLLPVIGGVAALGVVYTLLKKKKTTTVPYAAPSAFAPETDGGFEETALTGAKAPPPSTLLSRGIVSRVASVQQYADQLNKYGTGSGKPYVYTPASGDLVDVVAHRFGLNSAAEITQIPSNPISGPQWLVPRGSIDTTGPIKMAMGTISIR